jgi:23S rRNA pseudouridine955/2504/2580 synthase
MREFIINFNDAGQRVDKFLSKAVKKLPKSLMYKYLRTKRIKLNNKKCEISTKLNEGDVLSLYINDEFFDENEQLDFLSVPTNLNIIYEDENILLIDKKNGLVVHEDDENTVDTLINRIKHYLYEKGEYNPENEASFAPSLCNRLDRNTGGIIICAKNAESLRILNQKVKDRELEKLYLCITVGIPPKKEDTLTAYLEKDEGKNQVFISNKKTQTNKTIVTQYKVLETKDNLALVEVDLITGRTHQIRAHMAYIGCPLLGDGKYGINKINRAYNIKTQALYSYKLTFKFKTEAGILQYLDGKTFTADNIWFKKLLK